MDENNSKDWETNNQTDLEKVNFGLSKSNKPKNFLDLLVKGEKRNSIDVQHHIKKIYKTVFKERRCQKDIHFTVEKGEYVLSWESGSNPPSSISLAMLVADGRADA